jgi:hypothetical protein
MASSTENIHLGPCKVYYDDVDLGYTKGGVEVTVSSDTYEVTVDQFGSTPVEEIITGRNVVIKTPLAETTMENLVKIMPGATLVTTPAVKAVGTVDFTANAAADDTLTVNGTVFTFKASGASGNQINVGATLPDTLTNIVTVLNASVVVGVALATYTSNSTDTITVTVDLAGVAGNDFTLAASVVAGATVVEPVGGAAAKNRVDVTNATGESLLAGAKELRLHPISLEDTDYSQDFYAPKAATAGAINFSYKLDEERTFPVEWKAYPDSTSGFRQFFIGDPDAA